MEKRDVIDHIQLILNHIPNDWLTLTTHRLDIYNEDQAKIEFIDHLEDLIDNYNISKDNLYNLPTAYDYIRLGHPLSSVLEWAIGKLNSVQSKHVISFASMTMPIMAVLRKNLLSGVKTRILHTNSLPNLLNKEILSNVYSYDFEMINLSESETITPFEGKTILLNATNQIWNFETNYEVDFSINVSEDLGSIILIKKDSDLDYISEIQHVRRRESIAMTPSDALCVLKSLASESIPQIKETDLKNNKQGVINTIKEITGSQVNALVASSGLSMQYAITMGLIHQAFEQYPNKPINIVVPPNCYGGTNDQARRVASCLSQVEIVDLPVDGEHDMVDSVNKILDEIAREDAIPMIIAEIPTNPRVEVPDLVQLEKALKKKRKNKNGEDAIPPIFILDQTFCPNTRFLGEGDILSTVPCISYVSGSKFPSGGRCTAGYCTANEWAKDSMKKIEFHLGLCDNEATPLQYQILAEQMPSMVQRIEQAYINTLEFVTFIKSTLPSAKINFVSEELANQGFTPSVFSLDLPTRGNSEQEREEYKRKLNHKLIQMMINNIPGESKYCVSYGQLKGLLLDHSSNINTRDN